MSTKDPIDAIDDFLDLLRREFRDNPDLAARAVKALGGSIELRGSKAADVLNPIELVAKHGLEGAKASLSAFSLAELKKIAKNHRLATPVDLNGKDEPTIIQMIVDRASNKIGERGS